MKDKLTFTILSLFLLLFSSGCSLKKHIADEDYLLWKNTVEVDNRDISEGDLEKLLKQKPNKKALLIYRLRLRAYNFGENKDGRLGQWLTGTFGEAPAILDSNLCYQSELQLKSYLQTKGFFHSQVDHNIDRSKRLKSQVSYQVKTGNRYSINSYDYGTQDSILLPFLQQYWLRRLVNSDDSYDEELLEKERKEFTAFVNRNGFYRFTKDLIHFEIDSNLSKYALNIKMNIQKISKRDSLNYSYLDQHQYRINKVYVVTDYSPLFSNIANAKRQFLPIKGYRSDSSMVDTNFIVLYNDELLINPKTLAQVIDIHHYDLYNVDKIDKTYKQLAGLRNFRYINIQFQEKNDTMVSQTWHLLDCYIRLTPAIKQSYTFETEITNSAGDPGAGLNIVYQNKNLFGGAEIFDVRASGAVEIRNLFNNPEDGETIDNLPFYIIEAGGALNLKVPKILAPVELNLFPKSFARKTVIESGYNFQKRPDYTRNIANLNFGYSFNLSSKEQLLFNPVVINLVKINKSDEFQAVLNLVNNPLLTSQYSDHLINSMQVSYIFRNPKFTALGDNIYFRTNIEESGYITQLISAAAGLEQDENGSYRIFDIPFTQYIRMDFDFRYYLPIMKDNKIAFRSYVGLGPSTGNLKVLPFEKSFFAGGANGNRAWPIRSIGPGSYKDTSNTRFDKIGDYGIETSIEYRFPIYSYLKGAAFIDAGNVWLQNVNESFPGGEWKWDKFYKELALGAGLGLRVDFEYFIIRLDFGIPIRDPQYDLEDRWRFNDLKFRNIHTNIAVGYPF